MYNKLLNLYIDMYSRFDKVHIQINQVQYKINDFDNNF